MTDDPGPEFWALQSRQLVVITALREVIDADPDRFTGLSTQGSAAAGIEVGVTPGARPLRELNRIHDAILRTDPFRVNGVRRPSSASIR